MHEFAAAALSGTGQQQHNAAALPAPLLPRLQDMLQMPCGPGNKAVLRFTRHTTWVDGCDPGPQLCHMPFGPC